MSEQDEELARLREELKQTRLDLLNSDAIRSAFVEQSSGLAKDMARALSMVEAAFMAGHTAGAARPYQPASEAFNEWTKEITK